MSDPEMKPEYFEESLQRVTDECDGILLEWYGRKQVSNLDECDVVERASHTLQYLIELIENEGEARVNVIEDSWVHLRNQAQLVLTSEHNEPMTFEDEVRGLSQECDQLLIDKQKDYGPKNITMFGEYGVLVRSNDKLQRLKNLLGNGKDPENESIRDTWVDLRNYAQIALMVRRKQFDLPLKEGAVIGVDEAVGGDETVASNITDDEFDAAMAKRG